MILRGSLRSFIFNQLITNNEKKTVWFVQLGTVSVMFELCGFWKGNTSESLVNAFVNLWQLRKCMCHHELWLVCPLRFSNITASVNQSRTFYLIEVTHSQFPFLVSWELCPGTLLGRGGGRCLLGSPRNCLCPSKMCQQQSTL